jgi:FkbH-like protein
MKMFKDKSLAIIGSCSSLYLYKEIQEDFKEVYYSFANKDSTSIYDAINDSSSVVNKKRFDIYMIDINDTIRQILFNTASSSLNDKDDTFYDESMEQILFQYETSIQNLKDKYKNIVIIINKYIINPYNNKLFSYKYTSNILKNYYKYGYTLYDLVNKHNDVYLYDSDIISNVYLKYTLAPPNHSYSGKFGEIYGSHIDPKISKEQRELFLNILTGIYRKNEIKCVVVDLDNTMWQGVFLESNKNKCKLNLFRAQILFQLYKQGIILCVCSKNNPDEKTLEELKAILKSISTHILIYKVNWKPKSENLREITKELNISPKNIAFFDDQEFERNEVKSNFPEINVFTDEELDTILLNGRFNVPIISDESTTRTEKYKLNIKRDQEELKNTENNNSGDNYINYLKTLNFEISITSAKTEDNYIRAFELIQRTNQQNITIKRLTLDEIKEFNKENEILLFNLKDKFGEYGIICCILLKKINNNTYEIYEFAMSCRAMGKKIEESILVYVNNYALTQKINSIKCNYIENEKNKSFMKQFIDFGYIKQDNEMIYNVKENKEYSEWIKIVK